MILPRASTHLNPALPTRPDTTRQMSAVNVYIHIHTHTNLYGAKNRENESEALAGVSRGSQH